MFLTIYSFLFSGKVIDGIGLATGTPVVILALTSPFPIRDVNHGLLIGVLRAILCGLALDIVLGRGLAWLPVVSHEDTVFFGEVDHAVEFVLLANQDFLFGGEIIAGAFAFEDRAVSGKNIAVAFGAVTVAPDLEGGLIVGG